MISKTKNENANQIEIKLKKKKCILLSSWSSKESNFVFRKVQCW